MTVAELIEKLGEFPPETLVFVMVPRGMYSEMEREAPMPHLVKGEGEPDWVFIE